MMALTPAVGLSLFFVVLQGLFSIVVFPIYFTRLRDSPIIKARSRYLELYMWFFITLFQLRAFENVYSIDYPGVISCTTLIWSGWIVSTITFYFSQIAFNSYSATYIEMRTLDSDLCCDNQQTKTNDQRGS